MVQGAAPPFSLPHINKQPQKWRVRASVRQKAALGFQAVPSLPLPASDSFTRDLTIDRKSASGPEFEQDNTIHEELSSRERFTAWMVQYNHEEKHFQSTAVFCEVVLQQVQTVTSLLPSPCSLRICVCGYLFERVIPQLGRYESIMKSIFEQVVQGLYLPGTVDYSNKTASQLIALAQGKSVKEDISDKRLYVDAYRESTATVKALQFKIGSLSDTMGKLGKIIESGIRAWQDIYCKRVFTAWRNWHITHRQLVYVKSKRMDRFSSEMDSHRMELAFIRWRWYTSSEFLRRSREKETNLQYQIGNAKTHFSLQCFKTDRYLRNIDELRQEIQRTSAAMNEEMGRRIKAEESLSKRDADRNKIWAGRMSRLSERVEDYSTMCSSILAAFASPEGKLPLETVLPQGWTIRGKMEKKRSRRGMRAPDSSGKLASTSGSPTTNDAEEVLIKWINALLQQSNLTGRMISNFSQDFTDGEVFVIIMNTIAPNLCSLRPLKETESLRRAEGIIMNFGKLNIMGVVQPSDIVEGAADLIIVLLAELFSKYATNSIPDVTEGQTEETEKFDIKQTSSAYNLDPDGKLSEEGPVTIPQPPSGPRKSGSKPSTPRNGGSADAGSEPSSRPSSKQRARSSGPRPHSRDKSSAQDDLQMEEQKELKDEDSADEEEADEQFAANFRVRSRSKDGFSRKKYPMIDSSTIKENMNDIRSDLLVLQEKFEVTVDSYKQWNKLSDLVQDYAKFLLKKRAEGVPVIIADLQDYNRFTRVPKQHMKDLASKFGAGWDEQVEGIQKVLRMYYSDIRRIFMYYCSLISQDKNISYQEFWRFVTDCKLPDKVLTKAAIDEIFNQANTSTEDQTEQMLRGFDDVNPASELVPNEFVECLIRMAEVKFPKHPMLHMRFQYLIQHFVLPKAAKSDIDKFRKEIYARDMQAVVQRNLQDIQKVFHWYSRFDKRSRCARTLNLAEFLIVLKDANMVDAVLSEQSVATIFASVQADDQRSGSETDDSSEFVFTEFVEGLVAVCVYRVPSPFIPLSKRLESFLSQQFLPVIGTKMKIAGATSK